MKYEIVVKPRRYSEGPWRWEFQTFALWTDVRSSEVGRGLALFRWGARGAGKRMARKHFRSLRREPARFPYEVRQ